MVNVIVTVKKKEINKERNKNTELSNISYFIAQNYVGC